VNLAKTFAHTKIGNVPQVTYPVMGVPASTYLYQGYYYGSVVFPVQPTGLSTANQIFGVAAGINSFTYKKLPAPSSFPISVENGTGLTGQANLVAKQLVAKGFHVAATGNVTPVGPVSETVVWYGGPPPPANGNWTSPSLAAAQAVFSQFQGPAILGYNPKNVTAGALVTVQTGTGVTVRPIATTKNKSAPKPTLKSTSTSTTTVHGSPGVNTNQTFGARSPVNAALEPWDPRACNTAGTGPATGRGRNQPRRSSFSPVT
jgi:hypothetical protein